MTLSSRPAHAPSFATSVAVVLAILVVNGGAAAAEEVRGGVRGGVRFYDDIKPLLAVHCYRCHGPEAAKSGLRLDLRQRAMAGGKSGKPAIVPGDGGRSEMVRRILSSDVDERMPPEGQRLSHPEAERVRIWIDHGAQWPDKDDYWAFQPPRSPPVPTDSGVASVNPIDDFIGASLAAANITPAPPANARTLLRRAYADLLGVPPLPVEAEAFLNDTAPDAYEKLIDRLLADARYGERWARHWLDLVRYSESDGFEDDKIRPHAWRYRDYVIRSFNADKPYDRFVAEQIAGDELWPGDSDALIATGFARLGAWDGMSKEPAQQRQDFLNDAADTAGSVFLGMTVGCARCHDHKYDPITQRDYYALQAFFAGIRRETRELASAAHDPPHVAKALKEAQAALPKLRDERDSILRAARAEAEWARRCELDEKGRLKITDEQVRKQADLLSPTALPALDKQIKEWELVERMNRPVVEAVIESSAEAPKTLLLKGGELSRAGHEVLPGFIHAIVAGQTSAPITPPPGGKSTGRRAALARWLTSPDNPLTARVWVNRLWQHHFGRGLVATPSDFGRHGRQPTHPELLDWLACRLVCDGSSTKKMHRLMMMSAAYRRSSISVPTAAARDPENKLLWRMNRRRLDAEAIRDSILAVSGRLSDTRGGPGVYPRIPRDVNVQLPNNDKELSWGSSTDEEGRRRTVYIFQRRSLTFPLVEVFDGAVMSQSCPTRAHTTVAPQALALFNGEFCREQARHLAERALREAGDDIDRRIERVFVLALTRAPSPGELEWAKAFLTRQAEVRRGAAGAEIAAFADFCHVILNTNEFLYLD
jgi:hypothetical protein